MATTPKTQSSVGTALYIAATGAPTTFDAAGFSAQIYTKIEKVKNLSAFGPTYNVITSEYLDSRGVSKRKGTFDSGSLDGTLDIERGPGQVALEVAASSDDDFSFKMVFQDGTTYYVRGQVMEFMKNVGGPNQMLEGTFKIALNPIIDGLNESSAVKVPAP